MFFDLKKWRILSRDLLDYGRMILRQEEEHLYPQMIEKPPGSEILVLSPHPDDDVIACGGTLIKHYEVGDHITSVYLTDGRKGDPDFSNEDELVLVRKEEAKKAAKIIGIHELIFFDNRDQELTSSSKTVKELSQLLLDLRPDLVYLPFFFDNHPDHRATNRIFFDACKFIKFNFHCFAYEAWTPLVPNRIVDITQEMPRKCEAISQYLTQIKHINYVRLVKGLNAYRTLFASQNCLYAEAFFQIEREGYLHLFQNLR